MHLRYLLLFKVFHSFHSVPKLSGTFSNVTHPYPAGFNANDTFLVSIVAEIIFLFARKLQIFAYYL